MKKSILLIEDSEAEVDLMREAMTYLDEVEIYVKNDGIEALDWLGLDHNCGGSQNAPQLPNKICRQPDLILLDLNLPRLDGLEVLEAIKRDSRLKTIPVIILSTSTAPSDVLKAYQKGANMFVSKPFNYDEFNAVIATIDAFWFGIATLPPKTDQGL